MYMCASVMNVCNKISLLHTPVDYFCYFFDYEVSVQSDINLGKVASPFLEWAKSGYNLGYNPCMFEGN